MVDLRSHQLVNAENVRHFDVKSGFRLRIQVIELVNVEIALRILNGYH